MKRASILFPDDLAKVLALEAERRGVTTSQIVREAVLSYIAGPRTDQRVPKFVGLVNDGAAHSTASRADEVTRGLVQEVERDAFGGDR